MSDDWLHWSLVALLCSVALLGLAAAVWDWLVIRPSAEVEEWEPSIAQSHIDLVEVPHDWSENGWA